MQKSMVDTYVNPGQHKPSPYASLSGEDTEQPDSALQARLTPPRKRHDPLAKSLGWFSIGLGVAQLLAPRAVARTAGVGQNTALMRALAVREIVSGVGILSQQKSPARASGWLWSRVGGDAMDLAMLAYAASSSQSRRSRIALATTAVAGMALLDVLASVQHTPVRIEAASRAINVEKSITVNRSPEDCYRFWRNFDNFPRFMKHLESVQVINESRSHWVAKAPVGTSVEWDADIIEDQLGKILSWRSAEGAEVPNSGTIRFETPPNGRGCIVRVHMQYHPPGGQAGVLIAKLFGEEPSLQIDSDLRRFKQLIETGEITTTQGQPSGPRSALARLINKKGEQQ